MKSWEYNITLSFFSVLSFDIQIRWKKRHSKDIINLRSFLTGASKRPFHEGLNKNEESSYLAGMSPYISLKIKKRHYEHHMIEAHK